MSPEQHRGVAAGRGETAAERADRNFAEVVQELRVAQTGVQVLFAFLLSLPFLADFPADDRVFATIYTGALLSAAGAALVFIAPVAFHRLHFRQGRKEGVVWLTHGMSLLGLTLLVTAMAAAVWLVIRVLWSPAAGLVVVLAMIGGVIVLWIVVPRLLLRRGDAGASGWIPLTSGRDPAGAGRRRSGRSGPTPAGSTWVDGERRTPRRPS